MRMNVYDQRRWEDGADAYRTAVDAVHVQRAGYLTEQGKAELAAQHANLYERLLECLLHLGRLDEAVAVLEQSKARNLLDLLANRDLGPPQAPPDLVHEYDRLRFVLRRLVTTSTADSGVSSQPDSSGSDGDTRGAPAATCEAVLAEQRRHALRRLEEVSAELHRYDPDFLPAAPPVRFADVAAAVPAAPDSAVVLLALREADATALLLRRTLDGAVEPPRMEDVIPLPDLSRAWLGRRLFGAGADDESVGLLYAYWTGDHAHWAADLDRLLGELGMRLVAPLLPRLRLLGVRHLLLVPHHELHLLPLHACWTLDASGARRYLVDEVAVGYTPSLAVLARTPARTLPPVPHILGVLNPDGSLVFAAHELAGIAPPLGQVRALEPAAATVTGVRAGLTDGEYAVTHFSCHGRYDLGDPLRSALLLHTQQQQLTLADLYGVGDDDAGPDASLADQGAPQAVPDGAGRLRLHQALVVMSACETALSTLSSPTDEYEGLPAGLLYAGAAAVLGTLWRVNDLSTAVLIRHFYKEWLDRPSAVPTTGGVGIAEALRRAQCIVREMTAARVLEEWLTEEAIAAIPSLWAQIHYGRMRDELRAGDPQARPFERVEYWAGACAIGHVW
jgi:CHAT domain-containing protein